MSDQQTDSIMSRSANPSARANRSAQVDASPLVEVSAYATDSRYRLVRLEGVGWAPMSAGEFQDRVSAAFPDLDLADPRHVRWQDRPWQWPR